MGLPKSTYSWSELDKQVQSEILKYLRERITTDEDPCSFGKPLARNLASLWRYRIRDYRLVCNIEDDKLVVLVLRAAHRKNVYE